MSRIIKIILAILVPGILAAQDQVASILSSIESNNSTLKAYRKLLEVRKQDNATGIFTENPEVEFNYLWGDPGVIGKRKDLTVRQSFDFPTAYGIKKQITENKDLGAELKYEMERKLILFRAKLICNELTYLNALHNELGIRVQHARKIESAYQAKFEAGESSAMDNNKARLNLLNAEKELEINETEREAKLTELSALNGGGEIDFIGSRFPEVKLPDSFNEWYSVNEEKNTNIQLAKNEIALSEKQEKLAKALNLPRFSTGYMSESLPGESFQGVTLGISIPIWENRKNIQLAKAEQLAASEAASDTKIQAFNQLKLRFEKARSLSETIAGYKASLDLVNSSEMLKKALDAGELSLVEYMLELSLYYETIDRIFSLEQELGRQVAGLYFFNL